jgi:hypothetical protein
VRVGVDLVKPSFEQAALLLAAVAGELSQGMLYRALRTFLNVYSSFGSLRT